MKIHRWSIEGLGLPHRSDSGELPHGLALIRAADESSKRALLGVVPSVLFGDDKSPNGRFPGRGWLTFGCSGGEHRIEWDETVEPLARLVFPDGHVGSRADLRKLLYGADESLLRSVFVLNGDDLSSLERLSSEELASQLLSRINAGAETRGQAAADRLATRAVALLDSSGGGRIRQLSQDLVECRSQLEAAQAREAEWTSRFRVAKEHERELAQLEERSAVCRAQIRRSETLLRLWPVWHEMQVKSERLRELEAMDELSPEVGEQLANLRDRLSNAAATLQRLRHEVQQVDRQHAGTSYDDGLGAIADAVKSLEKELPAYRSRLMTLATTRAKQQECARELDRRMAEIGTGWGAKRAVRFDLEGLDEDAVRGWAVRMEEVVERERQAQQQLEEGKAELRAVCDLVAAELREDTPLAEDPLDEKWRALWRVRAQLDELWVVQSQGEAEARSVEEQEEALRALDAKKRFSISMSSAEVLRLLIGIAVILLLWRLSVGDMKSALLCAIGIGAFDAVRRVWSWRTRKVDAQERRQREAVTKKLEQARRARDARWKRADEIRNALVRDSALLGLPALPSVEAIEECEQALTAEGRRRAEDEGGGPRVNALVLRLLAAEGRDLERTEQWRRRHEDLRALRAEWELWRASAGLPDGVAAERISEWVEAVRTLKATWRAREQVSAEVKRLEPAISAWEQKVRDLLKRGGMPVAADLCGSALAEGLSALANRIRENEAALAERRRLADRSRELAERQAAIEAEMKTDREARRALLATAGVQDDAELERRLQTFSERRDLQTKVEKLRQSIDRELAEVEDGDTLRAALASDAGDDWSRARDEADAELRTIEERRAKLTGHGDSPESCWARLSEVPSLQGQCSALRTELLDAVREWRRLAIARALLRDSMKEMRQARVHAALHEASAILNRLSSGRYRGVSMDEGGKSLVVVDGEGRRHRVGAELDRQTKENLYLSIRLGTAASAAERGARLPLVMDDVGARLDAPRARALVAELERLSHDRQVLVFTCDRATCETVRQLGNGSHVVQV